MCHSRLLVSANFRGSSSVKYRSCTELRRGSNAGARIPDFVNYFYFNRHKIRVSSKTTSQILSLPSNLEYLPKAGKRDYDFLRKIIGKELALKILKVHLFKAKITNKECTHFTLYFGANKQDRVVALLELF